MKKLLAGLGALVLGVVPAGLAQPSLLWENWGQIIVPSTNMPYAPQIDAITFINHRGATFQISGTALFITSDTLNYTNQGVIGVFRASISRRIRRRWASRGWRPTSRT